MGYMDIRAAFRALFEGGGSVPGASPVPREGCLEIVAAVTGALREGGWECEATGSAGKAEVSSDVDILVLDGSGGGGMDSLAGFVSDRWGVDPSGISRAGGQLHFGYGYGRDTVQVDLELVPDLAMGLFFRHSPSPSESAWSGAHRTAFLCRMAKARPLDPGLYPTEVFTDSDGVPDRYVGEDKDFWGLSLMPRGLYVRRRTRAGVRKPVVKTPRVTEERLVSRDPSEIATVVLGPGAKVTDCDSLESLFSWAVSGRWPWGGDDVLSGIVHDMCWGDLVYGDKADDSERRRLFGWMRSEMRKAGMEYISPGR